MDLFKYIIIREWKHLRGSNRHYFGFGPVTIAKIGAVVEWLEQLGYGAVIYRKVVRSNPGFAIRRLKNSLSSPSSKWANFSDQRRVR